MKVMSMIFSMKYFRQIASKTFRSVPGSRRPLVTVCVPFTSYQALAWICSKRLCKPFRASLCRVGSSGNYSNMNGSSVMKSDLETFGNLVNLLNKELQRTGRVLLPLVDDTLYALNQINTCSPLQSLILLRCFGHGLVDERNVKRTEMVLELWKKLESLGVPFEVSHFNMLLKIHIENEHPVSPVDFLEEMEKKGVTPSVTTNEYFINKLCLDGDVSAAISLIDQMKKDDIPVSQSVFLSLITGHCRMKEFDSAREIITIMENSGLDGNVKGAEHNYLLGLIKAGESWDTIEVTLKEIAGKKIMFNDHDYFQIILALAKMGKSKEAQEISMKLPRESGFSNEMRNIVPQLVFAGEPYIALDLITSFTSPQAAKEGLIYGSFFLKALVKVELDQEIIMRILKKMGRFHEKCYNWVLEACVAQGKEEYGMRLWQRIQKDLGVKFLNVSYTFVTYEMSKLKSKQEIQDFMFLMSKLGLYLKVWVIADQIIPKILSPERSILYSLISFSKRDGKPFCKSDISNAAIFHFLKKKSPEDIKMAAHIMIHSRAAPGPNLWNEELAKSFYATRDFDSVITIVFASRYITHNILSPKVGKINHINTMKFLEHLHTLARDHKGSLYADDLLEEMLLKLKEFHLGLPRPVSKVLESLVTKEEVKTLIDVLAKMDGDNFWSRENIESFKRKRKSTVNSSQVHNNHEK